MGHITMSKKEREQLIVFEQVKSGDITQQEAAYKLKLSDRWVRKKFKRFMGSGVSGLVHQNRGKQSKKRWNEKDKNFSLDLLRSDWYGFGPTFAAEKLKELHNISISKETLRQAMIMGEVWQSKTRKRKSCKRRERREMIGIMIQFDGSSHDWFEGRGPICTLLVFIDDATSEILWLEFVKNENYIDVMKATKNYIECYGRPHEFYVDFGKVFSVNLNNPERDKKTQWERALEELGINVIHAHSPQAKGRVERANGTLQDRLVKELRLAGISSIDAANQFLRESDFSARHNQKFAVPAAKAGNAHRTTEGYNLDTVFCIKEDRVLANDFIISYNNRFFQIDGRQHAIRPKNIITVNTHLNGSVRLSIGKTDLVFKELPIRPTKPIAKEEKTKIDQSPRKPNAASKAWVGGRYLPQNRDRVTARVG